jgi:hypothetical protein
MKHIDWLHPDHIILSNLKNSNSYKVFTKHMRSRDFQDLRLLKFKDVDYIRYQFDGDFLWYSTILQKKGKDYYIEIDLLLSVISQELENNYITLNREEKLNKLLK